MSSLAQKAFAVLPKSLQRRIDPFEAAIKDVVKQAAQDAKRGARVLDAGAGEARHSGLFQHARYIAVDCGRGDSTWDYSRLTALADLQQLPFREGAFDIVLCIVVLEHVIDPQGVLQEFQRVLRPGARLYLVTPLMWEEHQQPRDYFRFTSSGLRLLLTRAGFHIEKIDAVGGFFWLLGRRSINLLSFLQHGWLWLLFVALAPFLGFLIPLGCYFLDFLDRRKSFTLGHRCIATVNEHPNR